MLKCHNEKVRKKKSEKNRSPPVVSSQPWSSLSAVCVLRAVSSVESRSHEKRSQWGIHELSRDTEPCTRAFLYCYPKTALLFLMWGSLVFRVEFTNSSREHKLVNHLFQLDECHLFVRSWGVVIGCLSWSICGQVSFMKMSPKSKKKKTFTQGSLNYFCSIHDFDDDEINRRENCNNCSSVSLGIWGVREENAVKAVRAVSLQSCTATEIKKELFDIKSDVKNILLKQSGP